MDVPDAVGDAPPEIDLQSATASMSRGVVRIKLRIDDLAVETGAWHVFIDTPRPGAPNYLVGLDMHYTFGETDGWELVPNGLDPWGNVYCSNGGRSRVARDVVTFRFKRSCIGNPWKIRIAVESQLFVGSTPDHEPVFERDHLVAKREFSAWLTTS